MIDLESQLRLVEDAVDVGAYLAENAGVLAPGWTPGAMDPAPEDEPGVYWLTMRPRSAPTERYFARVAWTRYPGAPPSVKYATGIRGRVDVTGAWPKIAGYRPANGDICSEFTKEGYDAHPEWVAQRPWPSTGNPFLWIAQILQGHLDRAYGGRAA